MSVGKQNFYCEHAAIRWCSRKPVGQDLKNYGQIEDAAFAHEQEKRRTADCCRERLLV